MRFVWPLADHYITRGFDYKSSIYIGGQHAAVDLVRLQGGTLGRDILAVADGIVVGDAYDSISGYFIVLEHGGGWRTTYRHMVTDAPPVVGQQVKQGQVIGYVGSTGLSTGPHLHFDLWHRQKQDSTAFSKSGWWAHNPELYLGQEDEMTDEEILAAFERLTNAGKLQPMIAKMRFHGVKADGKTKLAAVATLVRWFGSYDEHRNDGDVHSAGEGHGHKFSGQTEEA